MSPYRTAPNASIATPRVSMRAQCVCRDTEAPGLMHDKPFVLWQKGLERHLHFERASETPAWSGHALSYG
jgi:hypothetical protein